MKGGFEPATLESQVEHYTTEPKPLLIRENEIVNYKFYVERQLRSSQQRS